MIVSGDEKQSCKGQKSRILSYICCSTIKQGISHFGLILSTPSFVSLLFFLAGTLRSLPVQVRLLLVLAAAGGAQRGARFRQFSLPLLLLAKKSEYIRIQVNLN